VCIKTTRTGRSEWKEGVLGSGMARVGVSFVGGIWVVRWLVIRDDFGARIGWKGSCGVGGQSGNREAFSLRTIAERRGRRRGDKGRLGVHDKEEDKRAGQQDKTRYNLIGDSSLYLLYYHQTRTRIILARVFMLSAVSNEPATFSILRFNKKTRPYWTAE
jgi:hypothetical protein